MDVNLKGKKALITGSTSGIGQDIAMTLAKNGCDVCFNGRSAGKIEGLISEIRGMGQNAFFHSGDIWDYGQVQELVNNAYQDLGSIDILVVSGGSLEKVPGNYFLETDPEKFEDYAKGQWLSRMYVLRAAGPKLIEQDKAKVIFLGTDAGRWPTPGVSLPGGAGAALVMSTKVLAQEFSRHGVRINTLSTTVTQNTPGLENVLKARAAAKVFKKAVEKQPFPVYSRDVAQLALYLASEESDGITGQTFSINGGLSFPG